MKIIRRIFVAPIKFYQKHISPALGANCRFYPTCSQYAIEAIEEWGIIIGILLGIWRLLRCNPLCKGGFDPVPQKKKGKKKN